MSARPQRLVVVGSVVVDTAVDLPHLPPRGGDVLATGMRSMPGGGVNVLAAARRLGLAAVLAGHVGDGPNGLLVREALADLGVPVVVDTPPGADTGACVVLVEPDGERSFVTAPGVESRLTDADLGAVVPQAGDAVYVSGYELLYPVSGPAIERWLAGHEPWLVLDPGPLVGQVPPQRLDAVLARTHLLTLNARELDVLAGRRPGDDLGDLLGRLAPGAVVVARDGGRGAVVHGPDGVWQAPAPRVHPVDTTGAGDAHTGALLASLADGLPLPDAVARATVAAAISVTRRGSATGPTRAELDAALDAEPDAAS